MAEDVYAAFKAKFQTDLGRWPTQAEILNVGFLSQLSNDLLRLLPPDLLRQFSLSRLALFSNDDLIRLVPDLIPIFPNERLLTFSKDYLKGIITDPTRQAQLGITAAAPAAAPPATGPAPTTTPAVDIPADHAWIIEVGAQDWARRLRTSGFGWDQITISQLRKDMADAWTRRAADPKYAAIYKYAQRYYASTGWWPTEVEFNRYTQAIPGVQAILPKGETDVTFIPKGGGAEGGLAKWTIPTDPQGNTAPLPPGYEWRFGADGTPIPFDNDQARLDLFSGWYQDPKSGDWSYNPFLGAADYLQGGNQDWSDTIGGFLEKYGRMPTRDEARTLASQFWQGQGEEDKQRAELFYNSNGFFPTPYEMAFGTSSDTNANARGTGKAGQEGIGNVPVFVPGIGMVFTQGEAVAKGGFVFDPFNGIPGAVRPWIREILNGRMSRDSVPDEMKAWVDFALTKFQEQIPRKAPEEIPWGIPAPKAINTDLGAANFLNTWRTLMPAGTPDPTKAQMNDVGYLSTLDNRLIAALPVATLKQMPLDALAKVDNQTLINRLGTDFLSGFSNERLLGLDQYKGSGFSNDFLLRLSDDRLKTLPRDVLDKLVTDPGRRQRLGLEAATPKTPSPVAPVAQSPVVAPVVRPPTLAPPPVVAPPIAAPIATPIATPITGLTPPPSGPETNAPEYPYVEPPPAIPPFMDTRSQPALVAP